MAAPDPTQYDSSADEGVVVERPVEPLPVPEMAVDHLDVHARLSVSPGFALFRLRCS